MGFSFILPIAFPVIFKEVIYMNRTFFKKLCTSAAMLATCLTLFVVVLPFGTFVFGDNNYGVSTCSDEEPDYMNYR